MIMAQLREQQFALAALPAYVNGGAFGALARLATESKPDGVEPGRDSVKVTQRGMGPASKAFDRFRTKSHWYP